MAKVPPVPDRRPYRRIGKYDVLAHIATGGMGAVYKAIDSLGREVALKILPPDLAALPGKLERFRAEARSAAKLRHKNIVRLYEVGEADNTHYLALEFVDGIDLHRYIEQQGQLEPKESVRILIQAVRALEHLDKHSIVHRDIKPANFLISFRPNPNGRRPKLLVKLIDLGLALEASDTDFHVTKDGTTVGTVDYLAPEQARNSRAADIRSDIYALGCTWYQMLTGQPPFAEGTMVERLYKHIEAEPPDPRLLNPGVPAKLLPFLLRMLAKRPADRYQTPTELLHDLLRLKRRRLGARRGVPETESSVPAAPARPRRPSPSTRNIRATDAEPSTAVPAPNPDQQRAAAGQFERAREVVADGNYDYAIHLLLSCCQLDPANLKYRRVLRQTERQKFGKRRGRRFAWLTMLPARRRLKAAKRSHQYLKVLEHGEEVLTHNPWDLATQLDMADAAEALELMDMAIWILEEAHDPDVKNADVLRSLARLHEQGGNLKKAIALWELVRETDPADRTAAQRITDLAARDTIVRLKRQ
jgi:serine/threonine-protein kinase